MGIRDTAERYSVSDTVASTVHYMLLDMDASIDEKWCAAVLDTVKVTGRLDSAVIGAALAAFTARFAR